MPENNWNWKIWNNVSKSYLSLPSKQNVFSDDLFTCLFLSSQLNTFTTMLWFKIWPFVQPFHYRIENYIEGSWYYATFFRGPLYCISLEKWQNYDFTVLKGSWFYRFKGTVKRAELNRCGTRLVSKILWHKRIIPSLKERRLRHWILNGNFPQ